MSTVFSVLTLMMRMLMVILVLYYVNMLTSLPPNGQPPWPEALYLVVVRPIPVFARSVISPNILFCPPHSSKNPQIVYLYRYKIEEATNLI